MQETLGTAILILSFAIVLAGIRLKVHLSISIFLGAIILYGAYGLSFGNIIESMGGALASWKSIRLIALIFLVIFMSRLMKVAGTLQRISDSLKKAFSDARVSYGTIPAVIGLLPMPAGAYISAQMVDRAANELGTSAEERTFTNYWFRHVWEFSWPFYQGIIYTSALTGMAVRSLVIMMFPITLISIAVGYFYGIRPIPRNSHEKGDINGLKEFFLVLWPLWLVIAISIGLEIDLLWGLLITVIIMIAAYRLNMEKLREALRESLNYGIFLIVIAVILYNAALEDTGVALALREFMRIHGIPEILVVIAFPMIVGMMSGLTVAFVGISFPMIMGMLAPGGVPSMPMISLAYLSGFIGVLFSPLHLCLVYSSKYFEADLTVVFRKLAVPLITLFVLGASYSALLSQFLP